MVVDLDMRLENKEKVSAMGIELTTIGVKRELE